MPTKTSEARSTRKAPGKPPRAKTPVVQESAPVVEAPVAQAPVAKAPVAEASDNSARGKKPKKGIMTAKQLDHFQGLLLAERVRLEEEREQIRARSGSVDGALPEEGDGGDEDTADLASAMMDKEMDLSLEDEIEDLLAAVDHALVKIEDGTYGICDMSGDAIPLGRLELIPYAALTVECQALAEGG